MNAGREREVVWIRRLTAADEAAFVAAVRASAHIAPWADPPSDHESFAGWLARVERDDHESFLLVRSDGVLAGYVNVNAIVRGAFLSGYLGWSGFAGSLGRGLITEGVKLVVGECFTVLGLHRLEANIQPGNLASRRLAERCGFRLEGYSPRYLRVAGEWRDHERWALTSEEWPGPPANP